MSRILDNLYLSGNNEAEQEAQTHRLGVTAVLNVAEEVPSAAKEGDDPRNYKHVLLPEEKPFHDITACFADCADWICDRCSKGGTVLVHCRYGVSRSALVVMAYLVLHHKKTYMDAYHFVLSRRPEVEPLMFYQAQYQAWGQKYGPSE